MKNAVHQVAITPAELSVMLSRSPVTLERWRRLRKGPPHFYVGNRALYLVAEVDAWLAGRREQSGRENDGIGARKRTANRRAVCKG